MQKIILTALIAIFYITQGKTINLLQAIHQKQVKVSIMGKPDNDPMFSEGSSYYGKCLKMTLSNCSGSNMEYSIPAGSFIYPEDSSIQRMMIINSEMIVLAPGKTKTLGIYAMCTQMHDAAPQSETRLVMGNSSAGNLLALAQLIDQNNYVSSAAQHAIWALTDQNDIASIYCENEKEMNTLRSFVCKVLKKPLPTDEVSIDKNKTYVNIRNSIKKAYSGVVHFQTSERHQISMIMCDSTGNKILDFFKDQSCGISKNVSINYEFEYYDYPKGTYYVKIIGNRKEVLASQAIHLR